MNHFSKNFTNISYLKGLKRCSLEYLYLREPHWELFKPDHFKITRLPLQKMKWVHKNAFESQGRSHNYIFRDTKTWLDSDNCILYLKAFHGKKAWKSTLVHTNRDYVMQTLELFSKPNIYYEIKVGFSSYNISKDHLIQQLILCLYLNDQLCDRNNLLQNLYNCKGDFSKQNMDFDKKTEGSVKKSLIYFNKGEDLEINDRTALTKGIYKNINYWTNQKSKIYVQIEKKGYPVNFTEIYYQVVYLLDDLEDWEKAKYYENLCQFKVLAFNEADYFTLINNKIEDQRLSIIYTRRIMDQLQLFEPGSYMRKLLARILGSYGISGLQAFIDYYIEMYP